MKLSAGKYELVGRSDASPEAPKSTNTYAVAASIVASLNSIILGYDAGVMSGAVIFIRTDLGTTDLQIELLIGSLSIVSLFGATIGGRISDAIGRRWTLTLAALTFTMGSILMGIAQSFSVLMAGRLFAGIGVGFALMIIPVYTAEISPAYNRGSLVSLPEFFINAGILLGYISNYMLADLPLKLGWRLMLGLGAVPSLFLALGVLVMPESPRWLVMHNRNEEAMTVLRRTSSDENEANDRLTKILEASAVPVYDCTEFDEAGVQSKGNSEAPYRQTKRAGEGVWKELLLRPSAAVKRMLIVVLGVQFFQQATGIDATVYYSPEVFKEAGVRTESGLLGATIAVGLMKTSFILVATFLVDRVGRRILLLVSATGITLSLASIVMGFFLLQKGVDDDLAAIMTIIAVCSNVAFFSVGMGPVNWVLTSEIFPLRLRAQAAGLAVVINRVVSGLISTTFLSISNAITVGGTFLIFVFVSLLGVIFIYFYVPETKGKSLEEIEALFGYDRRENNLELQGV